MFSINPPTKCRLKNSYKKWSIKFRYFLKNEDKKKLKSKTINFGHIHQQDYVDHNDKHKRQVLMSRIRGYDTPFKSNFWRVYLLNNDEANVMAAYLKILHFYKLDWFNIWNEYKKSLSHQISFWLKNKFLTFI